MPNVGIASRMAGVRWVYGFVTGKSIRADLLYAEELARRYWKIASTAIESEVVRMALIGNSCLIRKMTVCMLQGVKMTEPEEGF